MKHGAWLLLFVAFPSWGLSPAAQEFMKITQQLEVVQSALDRDPQTARLEKRLGQLGPRLAKSADAEDLPAINRQRVEAFYRCD